MSKTKSLHEYVARIRASEAKWWAGKKAEAESRQAMKPTIFDFYEAASAKIVQWVQEDGVEIVEVAPAAFNGGIPVYSYSIAKLRESGIRVIPESSN